MDAEAFAALEARVTALTRPDPALLVYYLITTVLGVVTLPAALPLYFHYHTLRYGFDAEGLAMSYGVLFRRELHLTYARMQDIHLSQNILERWLGIGTVTVQTAGGAGGDLRIVGTRDFEAIRDYLYARLRGVRSGGLPAPAATAALAAPDASAQLLTEIRDELRAAARALSKEKAS
jgi:putative membrane protein